MTGPIDEVTVAREYLNGFVDTFEDLFVIQENKAEHFIETECSWRDE